MTPTEAPVTTGGQPETIKGLLEPVHSLEWTIFIALLTVEIFVFLHMCNSALSKVIFSLLTGRVGVKKITSSRSLVRIPRSFPSTHIPFIYTFHSTFDAHNTHYSMLISVTSEVK